MGLIRFLVPVLLILFFAGCAQMVPLEGGPRDMAAPVPDSAGITPPHASVNTVPEKIRIPFTEFIRLNNPTANIVVVPEIKPRPEYKIKGKDLIIDLSKSHLDSNTTYSFYFNRAIQDYSEGNDSIMNYVFATGPVIDSLTYSTVVIDAEQGVPVSEVLVGLYIPSDTLDPYLHKPKYFSQTDQQGIAKFSYLAEGEFEVFAFSGSTATLRPGKADPVAFLSHTIQIDTAANTDTLFIFPTFEKRLRLLTKEITAPGRILLTATREFTDADFVVKKDSVPIDFLLQETEKTDSVYLWIKAEELNSYSVDINWSDTSLSARLFLKKSSFSEPFTLKTNLARENRLGIFDTLQLISTVPLQDFDTSLLSVVDKDTNRVHVKSTFQEPSTLVIEGDFTPGEPYEITWLPEFATDFYDRKLEDTVVVRFQRKEEKNYSVLELVLKDRPDRPMVLRLFNDKNLIAEEMVYTSEDTLYTFSYLEPGNYIVQFVRDDNHNGQWDTGSYKDKIQPENCLWFRDPITLRANWENRVTLEFSTPKEENPDKQETEDSSEEKTVED